MKEAVVRVAFYCEEYGNAYWPGWGPALAEGGGGVPGGMGGSEEAVLYTARELASRGGVQVAVFAEQDTLLGVDDYGVLWLPHWAFNPNPATDAESDAAGAAAAAAGGGGGADSSPSSRHDRTSLFVAWRYASSLHLGKHYSRRLLWLHDNVGAILHAAVLSQVDAVLVQSDFHKSGLPQAAQAMAVVVPNGLDSLYVPPPSSPPSSSSSSPGESATADAAAGAAAAAVGTGLGANESICSNAREETGNTALVFVFGSNPTRGLLDVLEVWPTIHSALPGSVLRVYYGITDSLRTQMTKMWGRGRYQRWEGRVQELLLAPGVQYVGAVAHPALRAAYCDANFLLYPTTYPETGCITVMKAMASGAVPITSRFQGCVMLLLFSAHHSCCCCLFASCIHFTFSSSASSLDPAQLTQTLSHSLTFLQIGAAIRDGTS
jgi:glycosyltransferase involved in cell wall biosynthesis